MDDRDKKGRFIKQSRTEAFRLMTERLAVETYGKVPPEWQVTPIVKDAPVSRPWWMRD